MIEALKKIGRKCAQTLSEAFNSKYAQALVTAAWNMGGAVGSTFAVLTFFAKDVVGGVTVLPSLVIGGTSYLGAIAKSVLSEKASDELKKLEVFSEGLGEESGVPSDAKVLSLLKRDQLKLLAPVYYDNTFWVLNVINASLGSVVTTFGLFGPFLVHGVYDSQEYTSLNPGSQYEADFKYPLLAGGAGVAMAAFLYIYNGGEASDRALAIRYFAVLDEIAEKLNPDVTHDIPGVNSVIRSASEELKTWASEWKRVRTGHRDSAPSETIEVIRSSQKQEEHRPLLGIGTLNSNAV